MCLIIHKPAGAKFNPALFAAVKYHNPHGFGIMYADEGVIRARKGLLNLAQIIDIWDELQDKNIAIHFRYATEGLVSNENCHPFKVLSKDKDGRDLFLMHNGTLKSVPIVTKGRSDTWHFITNYLAPLLKNNPDLIDNSEFQKFVGGMIGTSKMLFMDGSGKVIIINRQLGSHRDDCWVSNQYSLKWPKHDPKRSRRRDEAARAATAVENSQNRTVPINRNVTPAQSNIIDLTKVREEADSSFRDLIGPVANPAFVEGSQLSFTGNTLMDTSILANEDSGSVLDDILPKSIWPRNAYMDE